MFVVLCFGAAIPSPTQTFTTLATFDGKNGEIPYGPLMQGTDGNFYGTTAMGGVGAYCMQSGGCGTVFRITPTGTLITLHNFCSKPNCQDGYWPLAGLVQGTDGNFYGTTLLGGENGYGTVFKITSERKLTTLYNFCSQPNCTDGEQPAAGVVQASDGNFYGTTAAGGTGAQSSGTVFKMTSKGNLTTLYSFCSQPNCADGQEPLAPLIQATDGNFYGTTYYGGTGYDETGTIFTITSEGALTTLYSFCSQPGCPDGSQPTSPLVQGPDGNLYGTALGDCCVLQEHRHTLGLGTGSVYEITLSGSTFTTLYTFCAKPNCVDGVYPAGGLALGTDGKFYGTTYEGGTVAYGTVFNITAGGNLTTLYDFCSEPNCTDGAFPEAGPIQGTDGTFYGLTSAGGSEGCGVAFSLSMGLGPFIETRPTIGEASSKVTILGNNLTGATAVEFNGTSAKFKIVSGTEITTKVPKGATSGFVTVTTPSQTLTSNVQFTVQ